MFMSCRVRGCVLAGAVAASAVWMSTQTQTVFAQDASATSPKGDATRPVLVASPDDAAARAKIQKALDAEVVFEFMNAPLSEVTGFLADRFHIPVIIDPRALDDAGMGSDTPVTCSLSGISLRSALRIVLDEMELTFTIGDSVLSITTPEEAESDLVIQLYPVADLMVPVTRSRSTLFRDDPSPELELLERLIGIISSIIAPDTWDNVGGAGILTPMDSSSLLSVAQTDEVHEQIQNLLATIRQVQQSNVDGLKGDEAKPPRPTSVAVVGPIERKAIERIEEALNRKTQLQFIDTPLDDVVAFLQESSGCPVVLDRRALDDAGMGGDTPVTMSLDGISLRSALRLMLKELELTHTVRHESLMITTPEEAECRLQCRVYSVSDLVVPMGQYSESGGQTGAFVPEEFDALIELITSDVAPESWDEVGGAGSISTMDSLGLLVISQTDEVHRQIGNLMAALRVARAKGSDIASKETSSGDKTDMFLRLYRIHSDPPPKSKAVVTPAQFGGGRGRPARRPAAPVSEIITAIVRIVAPESWKNGAEIHSVGSTLIVRQNAAAHREVDELLQALGVLDTYRQRGGGSGMGGMF